MFSLLVLLAPMGFEKCTLNRTKPLFFDPALSINPTVPIVPKSRLLTTPLTEPTLTLTQVRIVEGNWPEASLVPHVAGILIHDMLGLAVEYVRDGQNGTGTNSSRMYEMLENDEADLALTLWPAKFLNTDRSDALIKQCQKSLSTRCVATVGNQGYKARSGWFVSTNVSAVRGKEAEWSTIVNLYDRDHIDNLTKAIPPKSITQRDRDPPGRWP